MNTHPKHFAPLARLLHWLMAACIIAMLFIGARAALLLHPMSRDYQRVWFK